MENSRIDSNIETVLMRLKEESDKYINWFLELNGYILKIISIPGSEYIWVIASEENVFFVNTENGEIVKKFENVAELIFSAIIHPRSNELLIASSNGVFSFSPKGTSTCLVEKKSWFEHISISNDGNVLFSSSGNTLYIFELKENEFQLVSLDNSFNSTISDIIFNIDSFLVSNYGGVREYKTKDFTAFQLFEWKTSLLTTSWSPDKKYITASTQENCIHFWHYPFKIDNDFQISGYPSKITKIIWARSAKEFVVNCWDDVQIWDFSNGPPAGKKPITLSCGMGKITDIAYKGSILVATSDKGFIFYFLPSNSDSFIQIHSVDSEISCCSLNDNESKLFIGTKSGNLYCFEITF